MYEEQRLPILESYYRRLEINIREER